MNLILKNLKFVGSAQLFILIFGFIRSLLIPMFLSVEDFGYWQIYLFYSSYVGVFALGFNDGIYLRYGGVQYKELPHKRLRSAIRIHVLVLLFFSIAVLIYSNYIDDFQKQYVYWFISANILILGINGVFIYILQITNQMKMYSFYSILSKLILMVSIITFAIFDLNQYIYLVIIDLIASIVVVICMIINCKELWIGSNSNYVEAINEYKIDVSVGIKLMLAQLMGMLVIGIGRFIVEMLGNIEEYAYYSFGISITNLVLVMITSISLLLYPALKRIDEVSYPQYYEKINTILQKFCVVVPVFYFVASIFIPLFLSQYEQVLLYLNILFAIIILQAKMQLLNNTFYKALRKESAMMKANLSSVVLFTVLAVIIFTFTRSIWSIAFCTFLIMAWRTILSEIYLRKLMNIKNYRSIIIEFLYLSSFLVITTTINIYISLMLYSLFLLVVLYKNRLHILNFKKYRLLGRDYGK